LIESSITDGPQGDRPRDIAHTFFQVALAEIPFAEEYDNGHTRMGIPGLTITLPSLSAEAVTLSVVPTAVLGLVPASPVDAAAVFAPAPVPVLLLAVAVGCAPAAAAAGCAWFAKAGGTDTIVAMSQKPAAVISNFNDLLFCIIYSTSSLCDSCFALLRLMTCCSGSLALSNRMNHNRRRQVASWNRISMRIFWPVFQNFV